MPAQNSRTSPSDSCPHESGIIELRSCVGEMKSDILIIKTALVGNLETREPGIIDEIRSLKAARRADEADRRRWKGIAFGGIGAFVAAAGAWAWHFITGKNP